MPNFSYSSLLTFTTLMAVAETYGGATGQNLFLSTPQYKPCFNFLFLPGNFLPMDQFQEHRAVEQNIKQNPKL